MASGFSGRLVTAGEAIRRLQASACRRKLGRPYYPGLTWRNTVPACKQLPKLKAI
jgi:hypothetical protein